MNKNKRTLDYAKPVVEEGKPLKRRPRSQLTRCLDIIQWGIVIGIVVYFIAWFVNPPQR